MNHDVIVKVIRELSKIACNPAFLPSISRGARLLTGNAASAIPTVEYARYLGKRRYSRESPGENEPFSLTLRSFKARRLFARRRGPVQSVVCCSAAETSEHAAASHAWLARVRVSPSLFLFSTPFSVRALFLYSSPSCGLTGASLSFSLSRTCEPTAT